MVVTSLPPLDLLAKEKSEVYVLSKQCTEDKKESGKKVRQSLLDSWQMRWDEADTGRWTHRLISKLKPWLEWRHGKTFI